MTRTSLMKLGAFVQFTGHHVGAWRHHAAQADAGVNVHHYRHLAQTAERGRFDLLFLADMSGVREWPVAPLSRVAQYVASFEPITLLSALSSVTSHVGLVATATTTYWEPYYVARLFASLDHLSGGRAGWNLVTSVNQAEAYNFGKDAHLGHAERYARAREFADVVRGLWDSWDDDAFVRDKAAGIFFDPEGLQVLDHRGEHFTVRGPLNVPRSPQGHPVVVQAGSSEPGKDLAAATAEVVFTMHETRDNARAFYDDLKGRVDGYGRDPDHLKILPGIFPVVGRSEQEAQERFEELQSLVTPEVGRTLLSEMVGGADLTGLPVDGPLPPIEDTRGSKSALQFYSELSQREGLTIRDLYLRAACGRGHRQVHGTPEQIADQLEDWFVQKAADGFNIMPPHLPAGLEDFVDLVIPELQRRGLFRREYEGMTLRENLGLPRPARRRHDMVPVGGT